MREHEPITLDKKEVLTNGLYHYLQRKVKL
jgi:hypothetical protein